VTIIIATHASKADGEFLPIDKKYLGIDNIFEMIKTSCNLEIINFFLWCCGSKAILKKLNELKMPYIGGVLNDFFSSNHKTFFSF